jgi:hypothetical protein
LLCLRNRPASRVRTESLDETDEIALVVAVRSASRLSQSERDRERERDR